VSSQKKEGKTKREKKNGENKITKKLPNPKAIADIACPKPQREPILAAGH
jgi:hypothetical protein